MAQDKIAGLLEQRRTALAAFCIGHIGKAVGKYPFIKTFEDLLALLRLDPMNTFAVKSSVGADLTSTALQFIEAAYRKMERGYSTHEFDEDDRKTWQLYSRYADWSASQKLILYAENYATPFYRLRESRLFKTLKTDLSQTSLSNDSVQRALLNYLQEFEKTCNLDVLSVYMMGEPADAKYYFVARARMPPFDCYWRKAEIKLTDNSTNINPAQWDEWTAADIAGGAKVLDMRAVFWNGRLALIWADWHDMVNDKGGEHLPPRLEVWLAFMMQNGQWSAPFSLHNAELDVNATQAGFRLIATVLTEGAHPKGKLGVLLTNRNRPDQTTPAVDLYAVHDVLMRPVDDDDGCWLSVVADHRFIHADIVQHPMPPQDQLKIVDSPELEGNLVPYLHIQATILHLGDKDALIVRGLCKPTTSTSGEADFDLKLLKSGPEDPSPIEEKHSLTGGWYTRSMIVTRTAGAFVTPTEFSFGGAETLVGRKKYVVTAGDGMKPFVVPALEKNTANAAQFLALRQSQLKLTHVRLNSLFGPELVNLANISLEHLLDWATQHLTEPVPESEPDFAEPEGMFNGANALFFWELFFHLAHLVASRLRDEDRYQEALQWLHYLFAPHAPADGKPPAKPPYWRCRPLTGSGSPGWENEDTVDPDAIIYGAPEHGRKLVFFEYVTILIAWGDWHYRQLTRDSLVAARLCYDQARSLMGNPPLARTVDDWEPVKFGKLLEQSKSRPALEQFEKNLKFSLADIPAAAPKAPRLGLLANEPFKEPFNEKLLDLFNLPRRRLSHLRRNLTLDGKPLDVLLFEPQGDPAQLLRDLVAGAGGAPRPTAGRLLVCAFRWRVVYATALQAVQALQELGERVLRVIEARSQAQREQLQQGDMVELGHFAEKLQEQSIAQLEATLAALQQSRARAQEQADEYAKRYDQNVSDAEYEVMDTLQLAKQLSLSSVAIKGAGAVVASLPKIFGVANGGASPQEFANAAVYGLEIASAALQMDADKQATAEGYRRRREDWDLQRKQALAEVRVFDEQITAQGLAVEAARTSQLQTLTANRQALAMFNFLKNRAPNADFYSWLKGQLMALYRQAYDGAVSLCLTARASLNAEIGEFSTPLPSPPWQDRRFGLTTGDYLRGYLLRMEREHVQRFERLLEVEAFFSLKALFDDSSSTQDYSDWEAARLALTTSGKLAFRITQLHLDQQRPGEFCRQIRSVATHMPMLVGPYQTVSATLTQTSNKLAIQATTGSVKYLLKPDGLPPSDVVFGLRSGQQIALSRGIDDNGMVVMKPTDELLDPFETTGVISDWLLEFFWPQKEPQMSMLASLTDIILQVRYTAKAGDSTFTRAVQDLVTRTEEARQKRSMQEGNRHE